MNKSLEGALILQFLFHIYIYILIHYKYLFSVYLFNLQIRFETI